MKLFRNLGTLLEQPSIAREYVAYQLSRLKHRGEAVRRLPEGIEIGGLSGFSEFHSCVRFLNAGERRFLSELSLGDGAILDVGGNLGLFTLLLAKQFPERALHAFEPNPTTFHSMRMNFERNNCSNAHPWPVAVAEQEGTVFFQANPVDRATTHIVDASADAAGGVPVITVPSVTLDTWAERERIGAIALLKVDVEGYEDLVFRGAEYLLSTGQISTIYYEVCPDLARRASFTPEAASERLLAHGYSLHLLTEDGHLEPVNLARIQRVTLENWVAKRLADDTR